MYRGVRLSVACARAAGWFPGKTSRHGLLHLNLLQYLTLYTHHSIVVILVLCTILCLEFDSQQGDNVCPSLRILNAHNEFFNTR